MKPLDERSKGHFRMEISGYHHLKPQIKSASLTLFRLHMASNATQHEGQGVNNRIFLKKKLDLIPIKTLE